MVYTITLVQVEKNVVVVTTTPHFHCAQKNGYTEGKSPCTCSTMQPCKHSLHTLSTTTSYQYLLDYSRFISTIIVEMTLQTMIFLRNDLLTIKLEGIESSRY